MIQGDNTSTMFSQEIMDAHYWQACMCYLEHLIMKASTVLIEQGFKDYSVFVSYQEDQQNQKCLVDGSQSSQETDFAISNVNQYVCDHVLSNKDIKEDKSEEEKAEDQSSEDKLLQKKKKRPAKICTDCPHPLARHYAKNMCSNCYHSKGRNKKPWNCHHIHKSHYALGLCQNCYQLNYVRNKKEFSDDNSQDI